MHIPIHIRRHRKIASLLAYDSYGLFGFGPEREANHAQTDAKGEETTTGSSGLRGGAHALV